MPWAGRFPPGLDNSDSTQALGISRKNVLNSAVNINLDRVTGLCVCEERFSRRRFGFRRGFHTPWTTQGSGW